MACNVTDTGSTCQVGLCDSATGACGTTAVPDGAACSDNDKCTSGDACQGGSCVGAGVDCAALTTQCGAGECDSASGACIVRPLPDGTTCDDGNACSSGDTCLGGLCQGSGICPAVTHIPGADQPVDQVVEPAPKGCAAVPAGLTALLGGLLALGSRRRRRA
jgi:hypothetical protein